MIALAFWAIVGIFIGDFEWLAYIIDFFLKRFEMLGLLYGVELFVS